MNSGGLRERGHDDSFSRTVPENEIVHGHHHVPYLLYLRFLQSAAMRSVDGWSGDWTNVLKAATLAAGALGVAVADGRPMGSLLSALRTLAPYVGRCLFPLAG